MPFINKWLLDPKWKTIYRLGNAHVVGASFASFVFIALYGRGIAQVKEWLASLGKQLQIVTGDSASRTAYFGDWLLQMSGQMTMPLGLTLLIFSAIFAVIGKVVYETRCPQYIKQGDSLEQFRNAYSDALSILSKEFQALWNWLGPEARARMQKDVQTSHLLAFYSLEGNKSVADIPVLTSDTIIRFDYRHPHPGAARGGAPLTASLSNILRNRDFAVAILDVLREYRDGCNRYARVLCAISYYLAVTFAILAILYQAYWVAPLLF